MVARSQRPLWGSLGPDLCLSARASSASRARATRVHTLAGCVASNTSSSRLAERCSTLVEHYTHCEASRPVSSTMTLPLQLQLSRVAPVIEPVLALALALQATRQGRSRTNPNAARWIRRFGNSALRQHARLARRRPSLEPLWYLTIPPDDFGIAVSSLKAKCLLAVPADAC